MNKSTTFDFSRPIGVFDSGIGGMTVLKELIRAFPLENFIYLGDTARLPYGSKSADTVRKYSLQNIEFLVARNVKAVVVACNTASTQIVETEHAGIPIYDVISPSAKKACETTKNNKIAVLATRATVNAGTYSTKIKILLPEAMVTTQACPLFVPLAEEGWHSDPITNLIAYRYLQNLRSEEVDTVVLGCTHYPLLKESISRVLGKFIHLIDSGEAITEDLKIDFLNQRIRPNLDNTNPYLHICLTDSGEQFETLSLRLLSEVTKLTPRFETVSVI